MTGEIAEDEILSESYKQFLCEEDAELLETAEQHAKSSVIKKSRFPDDIEYPIVSFFHGIGIKMVPTPKNLPVLMARAAVHFSVEKPHFVLANMRTGLVQTGKQWETMTMENAKILLKSVDTTGQFHPDIATNSPPMTRRWVSSSSLSSLTSSGFWRGSGN